jgi:hypothetical protein
MTIQRHYRKSDLRRILGSGTNDNLPSTSNSTGSIDSKNSPGSVDHIKISANSNSNNRLMIDNTQADVVISNKALSSAFPPSEYSRRAQPQDSVDRLRQLYQAVGYPVDLGHSTIRVGTLDNSPGGCCSPGETRNVDGFVKRGQTPRHRRGT